MIEVGRVIHGDLGAETSIAQVRPVANLTVADAHQIGQPVAAEIGEINRLGAVGKDQARTFFFVQCLDDSADGAKTRFGQRRVPDKGFIFGNQYIGMTVTVQVDELQVGVSGIAVKAGSERSKRLPTFFAVVFIQTGCGAVEHHQVRLSVAGQIHELRPAGQRQIGFGCHTFQRCEFDRTLTDRAHVALVEPGVRLLGENTGDAFAVQVGPLIGRAVHTDGQVFQTGGIHFFYCVLHHGLGVFEFDRRQAAFQVTAAIAFIAGLGNGAQESIDRVAGTAGV